jgi:L-alanine-DL-glutamate epimerase-like enolase superfamily enzyme
MATLAAKSSTQFRIDNVQVFVYTIPTDLPESDGTLEWNKTTIVIVEAASGDTRGIGYTYADPSTGLLVKTLLREVVSGRNAMDVPGSWLAMQQAVRNLGQRGIAEMAISAVDIALWDLKARLLGIPLATLLGQTRTSTPIYGSGGFTSYSIDQLRKQLSDWVEAGIGMVKMKVGRNPTEDVGRVRRAREAIGKGPELFVDANGAYRRKQALELAYAFREQDVSWFEEPVSSDDLDGLRMMRDRAPAGMEIATGEYGYSAAYFARMLQAGAVDVLQADVTRCGGITGFLQASALCAAYSMPLSAHTAPSVHMHACCAIPNAIHLEYFHDHVRVENLVFEGVVKPVHGELAPDLNRPGLGLSLRSADLSKYEAR